MAEHPDSALVRKGFEAWNRGDMETVGSLMTADCTHHAPGESQVSGHFKGRDNIIGMYGQMFELTGGKMRVELDGIYVDGRGHAVAANKFFAERGDRGIEMKGALIFTIVGGKISDIDECVEDIEQSDAFWGKAE
ncbi:nuclear transport factor 2 family protein [Streptomyces lateritius]|uniref:Nuclear transport factor 2 family protein n=1 Tax=Streptomyces lateritius TaxID=67313 RepID=A0ABW6YL26_9ACTN|nr:nuclear transport factor 2 family protein [Streptomyces sp. QHH-9511]QGZ50054.1 nuclear transport factor 2 family protein [Streptomyces sp. QHH-9511]